MNQEGGAQNYQEYFYGKSKEQVSSTVPEEVVDPELLIVPEDEKGLKSKIAKIKTEISKAGEKQKRFAVIKYYEIYPEAVVDKPKDMAKVIEILQNQQKVLGAKILEMKPKTPWRKKIASFLSLFS